MHVSSRSACKISAPAAERHEFVLVVQGRSHLTEHLLMNHKLRILTNMRRLAGAQSLQNMNVEIDVYEPGTMLSAVMALARSFRYDYILLNGAIKQGLFISILKLVIPFHKPKLVLLDVLLPAASNAWGRLRAWLIGKLLSRVHIIMLHYRNTEGITEHYNVSDEKFAYIPFKINQKEYIAQLPTMDNGYVFSGGKTRRDFETLFAAVKDLGIPVKIVTTDNSDIEPHGSYLDERAAPSNVEIIRSDGSPETFLAHMASAMLVVLPIKPDICGAGISVYLQAMALRKCVVISAGPGVDDVLTEGQAIIVPPSDAAALRAALETAVADPAYRERFESRGYEYAISLGGEEQLFESILRHLRTDSMD